MKKHDFQIGDIIKYEDKENGYVYGEIVDIHGDELQAEYTDDSWETFYISKEKAEYIEPVYIDEETACRLARYEMTAAELIGDVYPPQRVDDDKLRVGVGIQIVFQFFLKSSAQRPRRHREAQIRRRFVGQLYQAVLDAFERVFQAEVENAALRRSIPQNGSPAASLRARSSISQLLPAFGAPEIILTTSGTRPSTRKQLFGNGLSISVAAAMELKPFISSAYGLYTPAPFSPFIGSPPGPSRRGTSSDRLSG